MDLMKYLARVRDSRPPKQSGITQLFPSGPAYATGAETRAAIIAEAAKSIDDTGGRPLPLVAHWASEYLPLSWQLDKIDDGYPIIPHIKWAKGNGWGNDAMASVASAGLPITFVSTQWDGELLTASAYTSLSDSDTAQTVGDPDRTADISPMGTTTAWATLGADWGGDSYLDTQQTTYAAPPQVFFASNNEARYLSYQYATNDVRYEDTYGTGRTLAQKASDFHYRLIDRWNALFDSWKGAMQSSTWADNTRHIGYEAVGPRKIKYYRTWPYSPNASRHDAMVDGTFTRLRWQPYAWGGEVAECYDNHWEWNDAEYPNGGCKAPWLVFSPQNEACNWRFSFDIALSVNPGFWTECLFWDGELWNDSPPSGFAGAASDKGLAYAAAGVDPTPGYYKGWCQYVLWLVQPRMAREFRTSTTNVPSTHSAYYDAILDMVAHVHQHPTLRRFWRDGTLVENVTRQHPFEDGTEVADSSISGAAWNGYPKWYHLPTSEDPALAADIELYTNNENIVWPVYTLAYVIGTTPNREWLVYAHATGGSTLTDVDVTIPDYETITLPTVPVQGAFYLVVE